MLSIVPLNYFRKCANNRNVVIKLLFFIVGYREICVPAGPIKTIVKVFLNSAIFKEVSHNSVVTETGINVVI